MWMSRILPTFLPAVPQQPPTINNARNCEYPLARSEDVMKVVALLCVALVYAPKPVLPPV